MGRIELEKNWSKLGFQLTRRSTGRKEDADERTSGWERREGQRFQIPYLV